jgi:hypothetical protein
MFEVDAGEAVAHTGSPDLESLPVSYFNSQRAQGFEWVFFTNVPDDFDFTALSASAHRGGLRLLINGVFDQPADDDGLILPDADPTTTKYDYCYDPTFLDALRAQDPARFVWYLEHPGTIRLEHMVHFSATDGLEFSERAPYVASVALLLLPGLRVLRHCDWDIVGQLLPVLTRPVLVSGIFSIPEVVRYHGTMIVWKYATEIEHVVICLNFTNDHSVANIVCPDAPDPIEYDKIQVFEYLTETTFRRSAEVMRTTGLHVILREYEIQLFAY